MGRPGVTPGGLGARRYARTAPQFRAANAAAGSGKLALIGEDRAFYHPPGAIYASAFDEHPLAGLVGLCFIAAVLVLLVRLTDSSKSQSYVPQGWQPMTTAAPGWYPDTTDPNVLRYFDVDLLPRLKIAGFPMPLARHRVFSLARAHPRVRVLPPARRCARAW